MTTLRALSPANPSPSLSIVMPVFNEQRTVAVAIERVLAVDFPCRSELIVVNDGSSDETAQILSGYERIGVKVISLPRNRGKGAAVEAGVAAATGSHMIILDADLEYAPADIVQMLEPVIAGKTNHVFGARVFGYNTAFTSFKFAVGGRFTTFVANMLFDSWITDMHTCLKLVPVADFAAMSFRERGFGLDSELTAKLLRAGVRPFEVPVSYHGRTVAAGKKISWWDGLRCLAVLFRERLRRPLALNLETLPLEAVLTASPDLALDQKLELMAESYVVDGVESFLATHLDA
jgi:dolichol-phosphate hexosyltransferase